MEPVGNLETVTLDHIVLDAGAIIRGYGYSFTKISQNIWTIAEVISEIRDSKSREFLDSLPYQIEIRNPSDVAMRAVANFAKKTGDFAALSLTDLKLMALLYTLECEVNGDKHIRIEPKAMRSSSQSAKPLNKRDGAGSKEIVVANPNSKTVADTNELGIATSKVREEIVQGDNDAEDDSDDDSEDDDQEVDDNSDNYDKDSVQVDKLGNVVGFELDPDATSCCVSSTEIEPAKRSQLNVSFEPESVPMLPAFNDEDFPPLSAATAFDESDADSDGGLSDSLHSCCCGHDDAKGEEDVDAGPWTEVGAPQAAKQKISGASKSITKPTKNSSAGGANGSTSVTPVVLGGAEARTAIATGAAAAAPMKSVWGSVPSTVKSAVATVAPAKSPGASVKAPWTSSATATATAPISAPTAVANSGESSAATSSSLFNWASVIQSATEVEQTQSATGSERAVEGPPLPAPPAGLTSQISPTVGGQSASAVSALSPPPPPSPQSQHQPSPHQQNEHKQQEKSMLPSRILSSGGGGNSRMASERAALEDDGSGWINVSNIASARAHGGSLSLSKPVTRAPTVTGGQSSADGAAAVTAIGDVVAGAAGAVGKPKRRAKTGPPAPPTKTACFTTDFSMQNVLIQMGLNVMSAEGMLLRKVKHWVLRCIGCYQVHYAMDRLFCSRCGGSSLSRVSATVDSATGELRLHLKQGYKPCLRGSKFSLPKPGSQGRYDGEILLREDQLLSGIWKQKCTQVNKDIRSTFGEDVTREVGLHINKGTSIKVGVGKRNPNAAKGRERRGQKKRN